MEVSKQNIDAAFAAAKDNEVALNVLESLFGKQKKRFENYTDIKTYEDACEFLGITPLPDDCAFTLENWVEYRPTADEIAYAKLKVIARAIRGGEDFSFAKAFEQGKYYYPYWYVCTKEYFEKELTDEERERGVLFGGYAHYGANAGFVCANVVHAPSYTYADFGSRLCFYDKERCLYFAKQFKELIAQFNFEGVE